MVRLNNLDRPRVPAEKTKMLCVGKKSSRNILWEHVEGGNLQIDATGNATESDGVIFDFHDRYWRVRHPDCDWEELNKREVLQGKKKPDLQQKRRVHFHESAISPKRN